MQGAGCRVQSTRCRVQGAKCRVQGAGCRVAGVGCGVVGVRLTAYLAEAGPGVGEDLDPHGVRHGVRLVEQLAER